ncbi:hypothetical protein DYU11_03685 [Fibrisoma montanum]|uniref:Uncharacterized protein n=1 Tax=Fibrisoma montanum TaxID=2305895 RepID=A0A418MIY0_9BACT|nr:outer membrane beta-barrel protein [Fibrisoma montanum]RIV27418.1 hypothetical protein DYU11_03685 [Fibrisoma montanum]
MKRILLLVTLIAALLYGAALPVFAQENDLARHRVELRFSYTMQRPFAAPTPTSLLYVRQAYRWRQGLGIGLRYYATGHLFTEYHLSFSPEGNGSNQQFTNVNYLKNSFLIGYSSRHTNQVMVDVFTGIDYNVRLGARLKNTVSGQSEPVSSYFRKTVLSLPLGVGLKTTIGSNLLVGVQSFVSVSQNVSAQSSARTTQFIVPAFRLTASTFLK